jgi:hypothetical protein
MTQELNHTNVDGVMKTLRRMIGRSDDNTSAFDGGLALMANHLV